MRHNRGSKTMTKHTGRCFCGAVEIEVTGAPKVMGYCHCNSCRSWSAAPVNAFTLWDPVDVSIVKGSENLALFSKRPTSERQFCRKCGGAHHDQSSHFRPDRRL